MGRLFWKFFFAFFIALLISIVGVGVSVSWFHERQMETAADFRDAPPPPPPDARPPPDGDRPPPPPGGNGPPPPRGLPPPTLPILAGLLGSLVASALLAWYFSRPIRHLRWALGEIAEGRFDTRVQQLMDGRRDELADLGRDVDITARKLDQLVSAQRRLLHEVSHELRSPLARIQAAIGLARLDAVPTGVTLDRVEHETMRLDAMVGQLLTLARLDAGTGTEPVIDVDVVDLLADIAQDARFEAQANGRDVEYSGEFPFVLRGRIELLHRAFENVVRNGVKYTAEGTTVSIVASLDTPQRLRIAVCDRGPGVPASELDLIFEPFHRVQGNNRDGFGLGLAIARRAVESHGGSMCAENRPDGGLCVVIELPKD